MVPYKLKLKYRTLVSILMFLQNRSIIPVRIGNMWSLELDFWGKIGW